MKVRGLAKSISRCKALHDARRLSFHCLRTNRLPLRYRIQLRHSSAFSARRIAAPPFVSLAPDQPSRAPSSLSEDDEPSRALTDSSGAFKRHHSLANVVSEVPRQSKGQPAWLDKRRIAWLSWRHKKKKNRPFFKVEGDSASERAYSDGETMTPSGEEEEEEEDDRSK